MSKERKKFREFLLANQTPLVVFTVAFALMLLLATAASAGLQATAYPRLCSSCHDNLAQTKGLEMSSHSQFKCMDCHQRPAFGILKTDEVAEAVAREVGLTRMVSNEVCKQCHSTNRTVSPSGDIQVPHERHLAQGLYCMKCHQGVVHGKEAVGGSGIIQFSGPAMTTCINCHIERGITTNCSACHTGDREPDSHKAAGWLTSHGERARQDIGVCAMCHAYTKLKAVKVTTQGEAGSFAQANAFCSQCHLNRPVTHTETWTVDHPIEARSDQEGCLVCHKDVPAEEGERVAEVYCGQCHRTLHPSNWRNLHPNVVKNVGVAEGKCFSCHTNKSCGDCHATARKRD